MSKTTLVSPGVERLNYRAAFVEEAMETECLNTYKEMIDTDDLYDQEIYWGQWTECFFQAGSITWLGLAAVPLLQKLLLRNHWYDKRPVWEYMLYLASHVEHIYFYYDRHPGPDYLSEENRWSNVSKREEARPWLRLAFHALREFRPVLENVLPGLVRSEKEFAYKLLWLTLAFGKQPLKAETRLELQTWASSYLRSKEDGHTIPNHNQLGLF